jgi:hypothetical protein
MSLPFFTGAMLFLLAFCLCLAKTLVPEASEKTLPAARTFLSARELPAD